MAAARLLQRRLTTSLLRKDRSFFPLSQGATTSLLQRRLISLVCQDRSQFPVSQQPKWPSWRTIGVRSVHLETETVDGAVASAENSKNHEDCPRVDLPEMPNYITAESNVKDKSLFSNLKTSPRHDLAMIFTCRVCETRSVKTVCRESYEKGVVVARCGGCNNLHLIADRLGWFGQPGSVEDLLAARGEEVRKGSIDTLNLTLEDLVGSGAKSS